MSEDNEKRLMIQALSHITKSIEKQNKILESINKNLEKQSKKSIELSLNSRINENYVFVTKMHIDEISEQSVLENWSLMLKSLGHVLLTMKEEAEKNEK